MGLLVGRFYEARKAGIIICRVFMLAKTELALLLLKNGVNRAVHPFLLVILAVGEVEAYDGVLSPFLLIIIYIESLEQLLAPLEIAAQRVDKQRLAEAARAAEEKVGSVSRHHLPHILRLVNIDRTTLAHSVEQLHAYGVASSLFFCLCHHFLVFDCFKTDFSRCKDTNKRGKNQIYLSFSE